MPAGAGTIHPGGRMKTSLRRHLAAGLVLPLVAAVTACAPRATSGLPRAPANVITAADIDRHPTTPTVEELLVRLVPGVQMQRRADGSIALQIMGISSRRGGTDPLFVVDGVPFERYGGTLGVNPRDIERIEVLKEGGSMAQYGMRGADGVILITTKNAQR